ncbi:hypothetical protein [Halogeometricum luteum]|uniref:ATP-grasp domain-containing protein n=1 Tax=Halogeometricum luteum TaxID=2950537 RepID=A0ABU2G609_9EURY|nr:hypothetical protein [Halogeometricum sp. S3BR5-2]MDS0296232.1 hypothetical protein [Halogeometricum sp. S3BR5-2]
MTRDARPTIGISYAASGGNPVKLRLFERVRTWADLILLKSEHRHPDLPEMGLDLYHMARWSPSAYADFESARDAGVPTVNSYEGARATEDRLASARACVDAGLPFVDFEYGTAAEITLDPPVLVKARHELDDDGHDFHRVFTGPIEFDGERMVERYVVPARSFKVFNVGENVRATERVSEDSEWEQVDVAGRFAELAADVAALFDLRLFELDILVHKNYYIIDINPVVSLDGVEDGVDVYEELLRTASGVG